MSHWWTGAKLVVGAVGGGAIALVIGAVWIATAPDNGFADLVAASVTAVVLMPIGVVIGLTAAAIGGRRSADG